MSQFTQYPIMPDEIKAVIDHLEDSTRIAAVAPVFEVAGDLHGWHKPEVRITVEVTGGTSDNFTATPRLDINVYAPNKPLAKTIALVTMAEIRSMKNVVTEELTVIRAVPSYPQDLTDLLNENPRFVFDVLLTVRPNY